MVFHTGGSREQDLQKIMAIADLVETSAMNLLDSGNRSVEIDCPECGGWDVLELDFCCGIESHCLSCDFRMHRYANGLVRNAGSITTETSMPYKTY